MRIALIGLLLAGCASPALQQMQMACQSGDVFACESVLAHERHIARVIAGPPVQPVAQQPMMWPAMQSPRTTQCSPDYLGGFTCTGY